MSGDRGINNKSNLINHESFLDEVIKFIYNYGLAKLLGVFEEYTLLCAAAKHNHRRVVKKLLIGNCKVNSENGEPSNTPLHFAVINCDIEVIKMLLDKGANTDAKNECGRTPIYNAIESDNIECIELLLAYNADVNVKDKFNISPLYLATENRRLQIIQHLLNHGANINIKEENGKTPFYIATEKGYEAAVALFLKYDADIYASTLDDLTPLHIAVKRGNISIVKLLLEHGANVDNQDKHGQSILNLAVEKQYITIIEEILKHRPDINNTSNRSSLNIAVCGYGETNKKIVEHLLEYGFCINPAGSNGSQLLHISIRKGYLKIVQSLLEYGIGVNTLHYSRSKGGFTSLHNAVLKKRENLAKLLISYGADINAQDDTGKTPLYYAVKNADCKLVKFLLSNKANIKDNSELLFIAVKNSSIKIVEALIHYGADVNAIDKCGRTALHFTAMNKMEHSIEFLIYEDLVNIQGEIVRLLLSKGANVNAQTNSGLTTLHVASQKGYLKVVEALLEYNADINFCDITGKTALHFTGLCNSKNNFDINAKAEIAKMLLRKGANVNAQTKRGTTTLHSAVCNGYVKVIDVLFQHNADTNICDIEGKTALHIFIMNDGKNFFKYFHTTVRDIDDNTDIAKMLIKNGANVDAQTKTGVTALHMAVETGCANIVKTLLKSNANVNCRMLNGFTPLHIATENEYLEIVQILLNFSVDINSTDNKGQIALHIAFFKNNTNIIETLLEHGSDINITCLENKSFCDIVFDGFNTHYKKPDLKLGELSYFQNLCLVSLAALKRHIIKLKAANLYVSEQNLQSVKYIGDMNNFQNKCMREIARAKCEKIDNTSISIYDILTNDTNLLTVCMKNENALQILKSKNYITRFPIYAGKIKHYFTKAMYMKESQEKDLLNDTLLHLATINGNIEGITLLLNEGADINARGENNKTPLYIASERAYEDAVVLFLKSDIDIDASTIDRLTPLHIAVKRGFVSVVKLLLEHGANVDNQDKHGQSILNLAVEKQYITIVKEILKYHPDIHNESNRSSLNIAMCGYGESNKKIFEDLLEYGFCFNPTDANDSQLLHTAVRKGYLKIVQILLEYGADVNSLLKPIFKGGFTPLHIAVMKKRKILAELLIRYGADINAQDNNGKTPLFYAVKKAEFNLVKILLTKKANIQDNNELLFIAVKNLSLEIVEALIHYGADVNAIDEYGRTALHFTALSKNKNFFPSIINRTLNIYIPRDIAKLLLSKGSNVNAQTKNGLTTLHIASQKGYLEIVEVLLEYNADINIRDIYGKTALHSTVMKENEDLNIYTIKKKKIIVKLLLSKGINVDAQTKSGVTVLHAATQKNNIHMVEILLKWNANVNCKLRNSFTPLHIAAEKSYLNITKILLKFDADVNSRDIKCRTALHLASQKNSVYVIKVLLEYGSDINITCIGNRTPLDYTFDWKKLFLKELDPDFNDNFHEDILPLICIFLVNANILSYHIIKLKAADLYVSNKNLQLIRYIGGLINYQNKCEEEITRIRLKKINNTNISVYDILVKNRNLLAAYMRNDIIVQNLQSKNYKTKFPIYASLINLHFRKGMHRKVLREKSKELFHFLFNNFCKFPYECTEKIFRYLCDEDLKIFINSFSAINVN